MTSSHRRRRRSLQTVSSAAPRICHSERAQIRIATGLPCRRRRCRLGAASMGLAHLLNVPFLFDARINMLAFAFSAGIGVLFGYLPRSVQRGSTPLRHSDTNSARGPRPLPCITPNLNLDCPYSTRGILRKCGDCIKGRLHGREFGERPVTGAGHNDRRRSQHLCDFAAHNVG